MGRMENVARQVLCAFNYQAVHLQNCINHYYMGCGGHAQCQLDSMIH